jgi:hypothetical protein
LTRGFSHAILVGSGLAGAACLLAVFVLSNSANRAFVKMAHNGKSGELELTAAAISEVEGVGAIGGFEAEREVGATAPPVAERV